MAANTSLDSYIIHDQPYTPFPVVVLTLGLGLIFLGLSLILPLEKNADAFAALAILPLYAASWMALQLDFPIGGVAGTISDSVLRTDHHIYPSTLLAIVCFVLGCVAIYQLYRLMTENKIIAKSDDPYFDEQ
jgi:hypothetical protein